MPCKGMGDEGRAQRDQAKTDKATRQKPCLGIRLRCHRIKEADAETVFQDAERGRGELARAHQPSLHGLLQEILVNVIARNLNVHGAVHGGLSRMRAIVGVAEVSHHIGQGAFVGLDHTCTSRKILIARQRPAAIKST
jgi:hypothetical protein